MPITRVTGGESSRTTDNVSREVGLVLLVDGRVVCRLQCSPAQLEELALGFLYTAGVLAAEAGKVPIRCEARDSEVQVDVSVGLGDRELAELRDSLVAGTACGSGVFSARGLDPFDCGRKIDTSYRIEAARISEAMREFQKRSEIFRATGGVHSAAILGGEGLVAFAEDVGRHNAIDKVIGCCLRSGRALHDKVALTTGRLSFDLVVKAVRAGLPVVASRSAPTDAAVELAGLMNLTLIGFVRGSRMNVYSAEWRIT
ncbi:MAG: formate dehydrogenase accessory sulfurtransferase FdhD [Anaerolineaceae bacterium]|nr:formate dehydrogenase accessory sulfurtransferase FdhD [Anaerolineaceae bacterium]